MGPVAPRHVGSSRTRARTRVPCIGRQILDHCATREAPSSLSQRTSLHHHLNTFMSLSKTNIFFSALYFSPATVLFLFFFFASKLVEFIVFIPPILHLPLNLVSCPTKIHYQHVINSNEHFQTSTLLALSALDTFIILGFPWHPSLLVLLLYLSMLQCPL